MVQPGFLLLAGKGDMKIVPAMADGLAFLPEGVVLRDEMGEATSN